MKIDSKKLELAMANSCLSSEELAENTGIAQATIARIKRGSQEPRPVTVGRIAKALGVKVEDLVS